MTPAQPSSSAGNNSTERSALIKTRSRTQRSNAATYTGIYDHLREFFAALPEARVRGYKPDRFSFNTRAGAAKLAPVKA